MASGVAAPAIDPSSSLSHLQWRATEFLLAFGPLTVGTVMDYFVLSPFFDRSSNNAVMRMQMMYSRGGMEEVDEEVELKQVRLSAKFVGIEYVVVHAAAPSLFIIQKRDRISPLEASAIAAYYVLNDNIYQGPTLFTVLNERILTSLHALTSSVELLRKHKPKWTAENLFAWSITSSPSSIPTASLSQPIVDSSVISINGEGKKSRGQSFEGIVEDEEAERPAETFNPLLFRALQSLAVTLPPLVAPVAPLEPKVEITLDQPIEDKPADNVAPKGRTGQKRAKQN